MPLSMYQASVPTFVQILTALSGVLDKAQACATAKKFDPAILLSARLAPSMFPMSRQVQIACDFAKGATARLAAAEVPSWPDHEKTFAELQERIKKTTDFVQSFKAAQIDGSEEREVKVSVAGQPVLFKGQPYLHAVRAAELLLSRHHRLRHPAPQRRGARQARLRRRRAGHGRVAALRTG